MRPLHNRAVNKACARFERFPKVPVPPWAE